MNIVILDGFTLNPGDLSWKSIEEFGDVRCFDRTSQDELVSRCREAEIIITNKAPVSADTIQSASKLKLICVTATGYNIVDGDAARKKNIPVCNVPGYGTASVAQHTFALILEIANRVGVNSDSVRSGDWVNSADFSYSKGSITELKGKKLGIIGMGKIGQQVATIARAFDMEVYFNSRSKKDLPASTYLDINALVETCDVISLHCPLTKDNEQFVNKDLLKHFRNTAWLINTSRGQLIQEHDLANALNSDQLAAAALDVLSAEPPSSSNPLITAKNCIITPHTAWISFEARERIMKITTDNIRRYINDAPMNIVN